ncbi:MAG: hypothetical protein PHY95_01955 [Candidatus ainarchaeum sp.]|nr:hypothetical protein [Candidatus ainarchaeum sp.]
MKEKLMGLALICLMAFSFGVNLLSNPGFETNSFQYTSNVFNTGITNDHWANTSYAMRSTVSHTGTYSMRINKVAGVSGRGFEQIVEFSIGNGTKMNASIWAKNTTKTSGHKYAMYVQYLNPAKGVIYFYSLGFYPTSTWTKYSINGMTVPANASYVQLIIVSLNTSYAQLAYFDDAELVPYTP